MASHPLNSRSSAELLADAERYDRWAERTRWNEQISDNFHRLALEARLRARLAKGDS
jgi:hypothetical protein